MRLTTFTDYTLRVLIHLAEHRTEIVTVHDIAELYGLSQHHLTKVAHALGQAGFVETMRGRYGGLRLRKAPAEIRIGDVVRLAEPDFYVAACLDPTSVPCLIEQRCSLKLVLARAIAAFLRELDAVTLETLMAKPESPQVVQWFGQGVTSHT